MRSKNSAAVIVSTVGNVRVINIADNPISGSFGWSGLSYLERPMRFLWKSNLMRRVAVLKVVKRQYIFVTYGL